MSPFVLIGLKDHTLETIQKMITGYESSLLTNNDQLMKFLDSPTESNALFIFCGLSITEVKPNEMAQTLRNCFPKARIYFVTDSTDGLEIKNFKKNGYNDIFVLPGDHLYLEQEAHKLKQLLGHEERRFAPVKVFDLEADSTLNFDLAVFLPLNKKFVVMSKQGAKMDKKKLDKFKEKAVSSVFIPEEHMDRFTTYCTDRILKMTDASGAMSETERSTKLRGTVRDLFQSIFETDGEAASFDGGKAIMSQCTSIVEKYVKKKTNFDMNSIMAILSDTNSIHTHSSSVSTIACLFSLGTGIGRPEDLALAGLFHDISLMNSPYQDVPNDFKFPNKEEEDKYKQHPINSLRYLKEKRMTITPEISAMIEQHHERVDGKGYPKQLLAHKIKPETQLLSLCDQLDNLTRVEPGKPRLSPLDALKIIGENGSVGLDIVAEVKRLLTK